MAGLSRHPPRGPVPGRHRVCDLLDAEQLERVARELEPDVVVHAQALSNVDRCEQAPEEARAQNVTAVEQLIRALADRPTWLLFISSDCVFDGRKRSPYTEEDPPNPLSVYGRSKAEGERRVLGHPRGIVIRPSTLFGPGRMQFCDHVVERLSAGEPVEAFVDQVISPTYTVDMADAIGELIATLGSTPNPGQPRIYHMANEGGCSRLEFAERIARLLDLPHTLIQQVSMADRRRAPRPAYSALTTVHLPARIGRRLRSWDDALQAYLRCR